MFVGEPTTEKFKKKLDNHLSRMIQIQNDAGGWLEDLQGFFQLCYSVKF